MKKLLFIIIPILFSCEMSKIIEITFDTEFGPIILELYPQNAPITVNNFLKYVDEDRYNNFHFYRVVHLNNQDLNNIKIEVIQGGLGGDKNSNELPPILHESTKETKVKHLDGTISMARIEPGSASSEIFICINNQPELDYNGMRNPDGQGFAAFGRVKSGMEIVKKIQQQPSNEQILERKIRVYSINRK